MARIRNDGRFRAAPGALVVVLAALSPWAPWARGQGIIHAGNGWDNSSYGRGVDGVGDLNHDGFDDFIVGIPLARPTGWGGQGRAQVRSGFDFSVLHTVDGDGQYWYTGSAVCGAGDVNGDGTPDFAVSEPGFGAPGGAGRVRLFSGLTGALLRTYWGVANEDNFGVAIANAGDVDADGVDDLVIGATFTDINGTSAGSAYVRSGATGAQLRIWRGDAAVDHFGSSVSGAGDVNGDGHDDVVVGAPEGLSGNEGYARVFSGADGSTLHHFQGTYQSARLGWSVCGAGDYNDDGFADVLVGSPGYGNGSGTHPGYARLYSGLDGSLLHQFSGDSSKDLFGRSVANVGDVNGDGEEDLAIGAPQDGGGNRGKIWIYSGADLSPMFTILGEGTNFLLGDSPGTYEGGGGLRAAGDVNGDGFADIIAGTSRADAVRVYSGTCGSASAVGSSCSGSGGFAPALSISGCAAAGCDLNLDVSQGLGAAQGLLVVGPSTAGVPLGGGCSLYVFPIQQIAAFTLGGSGAGNGTLSLPAGIPMTASGATASVQAFVIDPVGAKGYASTNGVKLVIP